ncbi:hypothetical protein ABN16_08630 [Levilactobacillus koreensis]|uniref:Uncharacterized protein n=1 Tax=Levilactobacillus koreensis TaxID=637971 RepID=A0AAC8UX26_9LACO|nr:hypothetical protein ABN16_08630 [Levilactobacillus koreensis]
MVKAGTQRSYKINSLTLRSRRLSGTKPRVGVLRPGGFPGLRTQAALEDSFFEASSRPGDRFLAPGLPHRAQSLTAYDDPHQIKLFDKEELHYVIHNSCRRKAFAPNG